MTDHPPSGLPQPQTVAEELWAIHVAGIDDIYAMPSKEEAQLQADIFNSASLTGAKVVTAVRWPYTEEAHAANMLENME